MDATLCGLNWSPQHSQEVFRRLRQQRTPAPQSRRMRLAPILALTTLIVLLGSALAV